jgi:hypothetical protein
LPWNAGSFGTQTTIVSGLDNPFAVAVDGGGNVYIADNDDDHVIKVPWTGNGYGTQTIVGSGLDYPVGVAVDGSGNVYIGDNGHSRVVKVPWTGNGYGTQTTVGSGLSYPYGVAVDGSGNVYFDDTTNQRVVKVPWTGSGYGTQTTVASGLNYPYGVAVDGSGNVYVADTHNNAVKMIDLSNPPSLSFASTEVGSTSSDSPQTVTIANSGNADLNFPAPRSGNNPSISANFTLDSSGTTACPLVSSGAGSPGTLAQGTSCALPISFVPTSSGGIGGSLVLTDNNLNASGATQTIPLSGTGLIATTTTLNSSLNPSIYGQAVTFTATVTSGDGTPTGTVQFSVDGSAVGSPQTLVGGSATYSTSALAAGTHSITAVYTTDSGSYFATSTSSSLSDTVNAAGTSTAVASSSSPYGFSTVDDSVTFTATVTPSTTPSSASAVVISGSVGFYLDGSSTPMSGCSALSYSTSTGNATATCTTSALTASGSPHSIVAGYLGDSNHNSSDNTAAPLSQTVNKASTTTTVASSSAGFPPTSSVDDSVTFTATVTPPSGAVVPRGTMTFTDNGSALCTSVSVTWHAGSSNATSACTTSALTASGSSHSIVAVYNGDGSDTNYIKSTSSILNQVVNKASTTTTVASSRAGNSSTVNASVTFTATVAPSPVPSLANELAISGSVNFQDSGTTITNCGAQPVSFNSGSSTYTATCTTSALVAGTHSSIDAVYAGDSNYITSTSSALQQTVSALATTIGVSASPSSSTSVNTAVTFTAQLAGGPFTVSPAGTVTFTIKGSSSPDCPDMTVNTSGRATCTTSRLTATSDAIVATYSGDLNYTVASAGTMTQTVSPMGTTTALDSTPNTGSHWTVDQPVTLKATVIPSSGTAYVPYSGSVTFTDTTGSITGCSSAVPVNTTTGVASCTAAALIAGNHSITATYAGDTNYNGNPSSALGNTVDKAATTTTVASSGSSSTVNQSVTFTATVAPSPSGTAYVSYSGSVTFLDGSNTIPGCITAVAVNTSTGLATCTTTALTAATHSIVATYSGDSNYIGSTSSTLPQTVSALATTIGVSASPSSSTSVNTAVTFTAQLAGGPFAVSPSGTVSFTVNSNSVADCPSMTVSSSGLATCTTSRLAAGSNTITATYSGDSNFTVATAGTATHTVNALAATLGVTASPSSSTMVNDSVTFTAQLAGVAFTPVVPSGTVNFTANGSTISGCVAVSVNASGRATCTTSSLAAGSDPIAATYSGDSNYTVSTAGTMTQTVTATTTTTAAFATLNYSSSSQTVSLSATVTSGSGAVNVGTVTFTVFNGGTLVGAAVTSGTVTSGAASATYTLPGGTAVGAYSIQAVYNASAPFATSSDSTHSFTVGKATATVTLGSLSQTYTGSALAATATTTPSGLTVNFTYNGSSTAPTTVGSYTVVGTISDSNYQGTNTGTLVIGKTSPAVTWATPAAITYGIALSSTQLNATASVPGTFAYTPVAGTGLSPGSQTLSVTFTPTDTADYSTATASVTLVVNKATPTITWATPASITYGMVLSSTQLNATASVTGTFVYSPAAGTTPAVGSDTLSVTFTPTDTTDYTTATASVTLVVTAYPVPVISSMSPAFTSAGGATFTLTITGTEFVSGSTAYWGTTALATTYMSATQLTAQVTAASIATAGTTAVTIQTPTPGGGTSNSILFEVDTSGSTTTAPTFTSLTATVTAGATASYPVTLPSSVTSVSVTCLNLPTGATCSYSSTTNTVTITTSSTTPKGTYQVTVVFTETVSGAATAGILLPIILLPLLFMRKKLAARGVWVTACLGLVLMAAAAFSTGCGGGGSTTQTHQVMSSGSVSLTVQ